MKTKIIYSALAVVGWCLAVYLTGSFIEAGFDIREWHGGLRSFAGLVMFLGSVALVGALGDMSLDDHNK